MSFKGLKIASVATVVATALMATVAVEQVPAGTLLPVHWDAAGVPDRFPDATTALWTPVVLTALLSLLLAAIPRIEPMQHRLEGSAALLSTAWWGLLGIMLLVEVMVAGPYLGFTPDPSLPLVGLGVLMLAIGNAMPKSRPGFFVGIRTPWAITDTDNWIATHRLGGMLFAVAGVIILFASLAPIDAEARQGLIVASILQAVAAPIAFSFLHWRRKVGGQMW